MLKTRLSAPTNAGSRGAISQYNPSTPLAQTAAAQLYQPVEIYNRH